MVGGVGRNLRGLGVADDAHHDDQADVHSQKISFLPTHRFQQSPRQQTTDNTQQVDMKTLYSKQ